MIKKKVIGVPFCNNKEMFWLFFILKSTMMNKINKIKKEQTIKNKQIFLLQIERECLCQF